MEASSVFPSGSRPGERLKWGTRAAPTYLLRAKAHMRRVLFRTVCSTPLLRFPETNNFQYEKGMRESEKVLASQSTKSSASIASFPGPCFHLSNVGGASLCSSQSSLPRSAQARTGSSRRWKEGGANRAEPTPATSFRLRLQGPNKNGVYYVLAVLDLRLGSTRIRRKKKEIIGIPFDSRKKGEGKSIGVTDAADRFHNRACVVLVSAISDNKTRKLL